MVKLKTKYIILFWIIILILFTYYCLFRLKYISGKIEKKIQEKYDNTPKLTGSNAIDWINDIEKKGKITDIAGCEYVYDDNIAVGNLGYNDCQTAYNDYVNKNFDVNNKFGQSKSLADICPVSAKSPTYRSCLNQLLFKFTNTSNIVDNITNDLTNLLNTRLSDRNTMLTDINKTFKPFLSSKNQTDFKGFMKNNNSVANNPDDVFNLVGNYYGNRYSSGYNVGMPKNIESFTNMVSQDIETLFFGYYTVLPGQFLVLDNINLSLSYDNIQTEETEQSEQPEEQTKQNAILTITNSDGFHLIANIDNINKFKQMTNCVILKLSNVNIIKNPTNSQTIQQLLSILGVNELSYLIMTYEENTSSENVLHKTYKLVNQNLDTIILLNKL
jgi:hypothetical protein